MQGLATANEYLRFFVTLTAVVDPFLAVPFFLAFEGARSEAEQRTLARLVAITVFVVLAVAAVTGEALLQLIGASLPAFRVGGGLVLLLMALAMLNAQAGGVRQSQDEARALQGGTQPRRGADSDSAARRAGRHQHDHHRRRTGRHRAPGGDPGMHRIGLPGDLGRAAPGARHRGPAWRHRAEHRDAHPGAAAGRHGSADHGRGPERRCFPDWRTEFKRWPI